MKEKLISQRLINIYLFLITLVIIALALTIFLSNNVSADTHWWDGEGADALFSNDLNWNSTAGNDIEPIAGDDIYYWDWDDSCTWDVTYEVNSVSISANYSGTITQGANDINIGAGGFAMAGPGPTFTGKNTQNVIDAGNFVCTGGTFTIYVTNLRLTGTGITLTPGSYLGGLEIQSGASVTLTVATRVLTFGSGVFHVHGALIVSGNLDVFMNPTIDGSVSGTSILSFYQNYGPYTFSSITSAISCPVSFDLTATGSASKTVTLGNPLTITNTLTVKSTHASYTVTLNINGKSLSATSITAGTWGIIKSSVVGARIDAGSIIVQTDGHIYGVNIEGIIYSDPILTVNNPNLYSYSATSNLTVKTWSKDSGNATWISVGSSNGTVYGTPPSVAYGHPEYFTLNIKLLDYMNDPFYQNYTITVNNLIPPPPDITSIPVLTLEQTYLYSYTLTANQTGGIWNFTSNATWLHLTLNILNGTDNNNGSYWVAITYINANGTGYQNYTLNVTGYVVIPPFVFNDEMILGLIFLIICFCISMVGYKTEIKLLPVIALIIALAVVVTMFSIFTGWTVYLVLLFLLVLGVIPLATWRK